MSFDIFLGSFKNGVTDRFPRTIVEDAFGSFVEFREKRCWSLLYPNGARGDLFVNEDPLVPGFSVNRPPAHPAFWQAILDVLNCTTSVLFWAGNGCVVASEKVVSNLPQDLIQSVGAPSVVTRPEQIVEIIEHSN